MLGIAADTLAKSFAYDKYMILTYATVIMMSVGCVAPIVAVRTHAHLRRAAIQCVYTMMCIRVSVCMQHSHYERFLAQGKLGVRKRCVRRVWVEFTVLLSTPPRWGTRVRHKLLLFRVLPSRSRFTFLRKFRYENTNARAKFGEIFKAKFAQKRKTTSAW